MRGKAPSMRVRIAGIILTIVIFGGPLAADAQQPGKVYRIGFLGAGSAPGYASSIAALRQGLRDLGYVEGRNIVIEFRWADMKLDRFDGLAAELVQLKADVIIVGSTGSIRAAKNATKTIPIVMAGGSAPLEAGLVPSLARPGGNVTGLTSSNVELSGKRLELLKEAVPSVTRVAVLALADYDSTPHSLRDAEDTGRALGLHLRTLWVKGPEGFEGAFAAASKEHAGALLILGGPIQAYNKQIADLALKSRLPAISPYRSFPEGGGLMSYGVDLSDLYRRAATHIDKIFRGAKPADLPLEQPTKFQLVINLKTAKTLGLPIPPSMLMRTDGVIE
jgi:putative tryptophan/tyrosine transport system substrate-binding protein